VLVCLCFTCFVWCVLFVLLSLVACSPRGRERREKGGEREVERESRRSSAPSLASLSVARSPFPFLSLLRPLSLDNAPAHPRPGPRSGSQGGSPADGRRGPPPGQRRLQGGRALERAAGEQRVREKRTGERRKKGAARAASHAVLGHPSAAHTPGVPTQASCPAREGVGCTRPGARGVRAGPDMRRRGQHETTTKKERLFPFYHPRPPSPPCSHPGAPPPAAGPRWPSSRSRPWSRPRRAASRPA